MEHLSDVKGKQIVTVTIADVPADADLEKIDATQRFLPTEDSIPAYAKFVASLAERKYEGPVTLLPASRHVSGMTRDYAIDKCALLLEQIWSQAGLTKPGKPPMTAEFAP